MRTQLHTNPSSHKGPSPVGTAIPRDPHPHKTSSVGTPSSIGTTPPGGGRDADLLGGAGAGLVLGQVPWDDGANDRQPLPRLQLGGQGQQLGLRRPQLLIQLQQHQQLRPAKARKAARIWEPGIRNGGVGGGLRQMWGCSPPAGRGGLPVFQAQEGEAGSAEGETPQSFPPLALRPGKEEERQR